MNQFVLKFPEHAKFTDEELFEFCSANNGLRIERNKLGQLVIMSPSGSLTGHLHFKIYSALARWYDDHESIGYIFDSSAGFRLPDGSVLAPDAAFIFKSRWDALSHEEKRKFSPLCPDFIIEVRSDSDSIKQLKSKMEDWMNNGCQLAWLIDPIDKKAFTYSKHAPIYTTENFSEGLKGEPILPGLVLDLSKLL